MLCFNKSAKKKMAVVFLGGRYEEMDLGQGVNQLPLLQRGDKTDLNT